MVVRQTGAARFYAEQLLGGPCRENESNPTIQTTATTVVKANPDRVGLVIINLAPNDLFVALSNAVSQTFGIRLPASGGSLSMIVTEDFTLPAREWDGILLNASGSVYVLEEIQDVILAPEGK